MRIITIFSFFAILLFFSAVNCFGGALEDLKAGDNAFRWKHDYNNAIILLTKAIESGELSKERLTYAYGVRAQTWGAKGKIEQALADYDEALARCNGNKEEWAKCWAVFNWRGAMWRQQQNFDKAISDFTKSIEHGNNGPWVFRHRGMMWWRKENDRRALADFEKSLDLVGTRYPNSPHDQANSYNYLANFLSTCNDPKVRDGKRAVRLAKIAVEKWENHGTLATLASAYAETGQFEEAIKIQEKSISLLEKKKSLSNDVDAQKKFYEYKKRWQEKEQERLKSYKAHKPWRVKWNLE